MSYFHAAATLRRELGEVGNYVASLAAKGEACLANHDLVIAYQCLQEALDHLQRSAGSGEYPTQNIWWVYNRVCSARQQFQEAERALRRAYELVRTKADQISSPDLRRSYLENVRVNAAIMAEMAKVDAPLE
jgi:tetratricopeptide (TPR) repeat protein